MKKRINLLLLTFVVLLAINLIIQSCQKDSYNSLRSSNESPSSISFRSDPDSIDYYKTMVAKCVARGLSNTEFQTFFKRVAARSEGNQDGFSLWRYRDTIVTPSLAAPQTLAAFLAYHGSQLGYSYNTAFFRGHLVRYIPNLSIGIAIWGTTKVSNYTFSSTLKVAVIPSTYYSDTINGGVSTLYSQTQSTSNVDVDNINYDIVYIEENPYYELFQWFVSITRQFCRVHKVIYRHDDFLLGVG